MRRSMQVVSAVTALLAVLSVALPAEAETPRLLLTVGMGALSGHGLVCSAHGDLESCANGMGGSTVDAAVSLRALSWLGVGARGAWGFGPHGRGRTDDGTTYSRSEHPGRGAIEARFYFLDTPGWSAWGSAEVGVAFVQQTVGDVTPSTVAPFDPAPVSRTVAGPAAGVGVGVAGVIVGPVVLGVEAHVVPARLESESAMWAALHSADGMSHYGSQTWVTVGIFVGCDLAL